MPQREPAKQTATPATIAQQALARMTLEQKVGQVFMLGFEGTTVNASNKALIQGLHLGGVTLFARNIDNGPQLARLDAELQTIADPLPLFISVDQEGGLVVRVTDGATIFPGNMAVGATGDPTLAKKVAEASANELLAMGVNMDLAPVVDVNTNPLNPVIGVRSFGSNVDLVSQFGTETIEGVQSSGVSAVAKHFPGHGDTDVDSHRDLPVVPHPLDRLQSLEFLPFKSAMQAGVDGIMTAHLYLPAIELQHDLPATLSRTVLTGLLRDQLGYQGLILTDALDMDAIKKDRTAAEAAVQAFEAGADMLLIAGITAEDRLHLGDGPPALLAAVRSGRVSQARLDASVSRILEAKAKRGILPGAVAAPTPPDVSVLNSPEHRALALEVARKAVSVQRDTAGLLPINPAYRVLVVEADAPTRSDVVDDQLAGSLLDAVRQYAPSTFGASPRTAPTAAQSADLIVFGTFDLAQHPEQQALARSLASTGKPVVAVGLRGPYDAAVATEIGTFLTVYGDRPVHLQAAADALFGRLTATARAP
ncbi:MAG: beta-N-acetylhexosaminidase [Chloroflexi bacterium]|nr:MAG: beta-N-acetylhexosaminidase [Chloroflexota bacterium]